MSLKRQLSLHNSNTSSIIDSVLDSQSLFYLHEENYIINPSKTEYVPLPFINFDTIKIDLQNRSINLNNRYPLIIKGHNGWSTIEATGSPRATALPYLKKFSHIGGSDVYGTKGFVMLGDQIAMCVAVRVDYIKDIFEQVMEAVIGSKFTQLMIDNGIEQEQEIQRIIRNKYNNTIFDFIIEEDMVENTHMFKNSRLLERICVSVEIEYDDYFGVYSPWNEYGMRTTDENLTNYFESKVFTQLSVPAFSNIEEPDNIAHDTISQWMHHDFQAEFPYVPA